MSELPFKSVPVRKGQFLVLPGDEVAEVITIPEVKPGKVPVAWATVRESVHKSRIGQTLIVSLFAIVEGAPQPGQVQLKKSLAEVVTVKPVEVKDLTKLSPIEYALHIESDGRITPEMLNLAGEYEGLSDKKLVGLLQERNLSQAGISYDILGKMKLQRPSIIARIAYHEAKGRERVPTRREIQVRPEPEKPKGEVTPPERPAKEPWQMTQKEWVDGHIKSPGMHREHIRLAIKAGKPVPAEVLKDYPELVKAKGPEVTREREEGYADLTAEVEAVHVKLSGYKKPNSLIATRELDVLEAKGIDVSEAREALENYTSIDRGDYDSAEDYADDRASAWDEFLEAVGAIDATEVEVKPVPKPDLTPHYGPPETASAEMKVQWNRMLGEVRRQYPLGEPVLENEAKRLGVTPKEMQLIIADERFGKHK